MDSHTCNTNGTATGNSNSNHGDIFGAAPLRLKRRDSATRLIPSLQQMTVSPQRPPRDSPPTSLSADIQTQQHQDGAAASTAATVTGGCEATMGTNVTPSRPPMSISRRTITAPVTHHPSSPFRIHNGGAMGGGSTHSSNTPPSGNSPDGPGTRKRPIQVARNQLFCDLTPVTRNTSGEEGGDLPPNAMMVVSPDDGSMLNGEHLAMPTALDAPSSTSLHASSSSTVSRRSSGPALPPLPNRRAMSIGQIDMSPMFATNAATNQSSAGGANFIRSGAPKLSKRHSVTHVPLAATSLLSSSSLHHHPHHQHQLQLHSHQNDGGNGNVGNNDPLSPLAEPISLPSDGRSHTFTTREEYDERKAQAEAHGEHQPQPMIGQRTLIPYQPTRRDLSDLQALPQEDLSQIFIARAPRPQLRRESSGCEDNNSLSNPFPLDNRTWSIPSLHMANRLASTGSVTSLASYYTDEEDPIHGATSSMMGDDDASLSSRGSMYMSDSHMLGEPILPASSSNSNRNDVFISSSFQPVFIGKPLEQPANFGGTNSNSNNNDSNTGNDRTVNTSRSYSYSYSNSSSSGGGNFGADPAQDDHPPRNRKRSKKEQRAVEWLRTVEANPDDIAEAASSKFLTASNAVTADIGPGTAHHQYQQPQIHQLNRPHQPVMLSATNNSNFAGVLASPVLQRRKISRQTSSPPTLDGPMD